MYYTKTSDRIRTMLTGTPLTAEKIRVRDDGIGSGFGGTSWFFTMHLIAKSLTRGTEDTIDFDSLLTTIKNYQIHDWSEKNKLQYIENKWINVYKQCGIGNIDLDKNNNITIDGTISSTEFRNFADSQYDYAMEKGLISYKPLLGWYKRSRKSDYVERILWHYITSIYDGPKVLSDAEDGCFLDGLFTDLTDTMERKGLAPQGISIWQKNDTLGGLEMLKDWERAFIAKKILYPFDIGDTTYIAPSFFSEIDLSVLNSSDSTEIVNFMTKIRKVPSYPISKGNREQYELAMQLQRATAIKIVEDPFKSPGIPPYVYVVSRDLFEEIEKILGYSYSTNPLSKWGDSSITDQFFVAIGRTNIFGHQMAPGVKLLNKNSKDDIDKVISNLEEHHEADISKLPKGILDPLKTINVVFGNNDTLNVNPQNRIFIEKFSEIWNQLINDPALYKIDFPAKNLIENKEREQVKEQIKKTTKQFFV